MINNKFNTNRASSGFTLIELVVGIMVFGIAMSLMFTLIAPQALRSIDPIYQLRATELANTLINEIQGKAFDENSNPALGINRCDDDVAVNACSSTLGPEELQRDFWDDVDDYHGLTIDGASLFSGSLYANDYINFNLAITVIYDGNYDAIDQGSVLAQRGAKLISITVTTPNGDDIKFATYRSNY